MGLELYGAIAAILALVGTLFAAFFKGKSSARKEAELDTLRATRDAQVKVGEAQGKDAAIDEEARRQVKEARGKIGGQKGDKYEL